MTFIVSRLGSRIALGYISWTSSKICSETNSRRFVGFLNVAKSGRGKISCCQIFIRSSRRICVWKQNFDGVLLLLAPVSEAALGASSVEAGRGNLNNCRVKAGRSSQDHSILTNSSRRAIFVWHLWRLAFARSSSLAQR